MENPQLKLTLYLLFIFYVIGGVVTILLSYLYHINKYHVGLIFLLSVVVGVLLSNRQGTVLTNVIKSEKKEIKVIIFKPLTIGYFIFLIGLLILFLDARSNYYLPISYFLLVAGIASIICIQILYPKKLSKIEVYTILSEIIILSSVVCASFLFLLPGSQGNDSLYHTDFIHTIIDSGRISYDRGYYTNYPLFHLIFAATSMIVGNFDLKSIQFIIAIVQICCFLFIFFVVKMLFGQKSALLSTLIISLSPYLFIGRYTYFPNSFSILFFIILLFIIFYFSKKSNNILIMSVLISIALVISHPLTAINLIIILIITLLALKLINSYNAIIPVNWVLFFSIFTIIWLMKPIPSMSKQLYTDLVNRAVLTIQMDQRSFTQATLAYLYPWVDILLTDLGFTILTLLGGVGAFYLLTRLYKQKYSIESVPSKIFSLSMILLILLPFPYLLAIINPYSLPERWFIFVELFACMFAGAALLSIFNYYGSERTVRPIFLCSLSVFILVFFLITTPSVNPNSHIYAEQLSERSALIEPEIVAGDLLKSIDPPSVHANAKYSLYFSFEYSSDQEILNPNDPFSYSRGITVIRNYDMRKGFIIPLYGSGGKLLEVIYPDKTFYNFINQEADKVYENGEVRFYFN